MKYRTFNTFEQLAAANSAWMAARQSAGIHDVCRGQELNPEVTSKWSEGRLTLDGRIACPVPTQWAEAFGGTEVDLTESDFPSEEV